MAKMNGCNDHMGGTRSDAKAQGKNRLSPNTFSRNSLSKGGVNTDLGGGATTAHKRPIKAGKAHDGKP